jgi:SP family sugar:H+ symporter-like MFS transporter
MQAAPAVVDDSAQEPIAVARVACIAAAAAIGGFLFGYDSAVINGAVPGIQATFRSGSAATGFAVASILIGCALGALLAGRLADAIGRAPSLLLTGVVFTLSAVWTGFVGSEATFNVARFLSGMAVGAASVVSPAYIAEISPAPIRGRLTTLMQMGIVVGIFAALLADYFVARAAGGVTGTLWLGLEAWRWMFLTEVLPALALVAAALWIPESPRYLVAIGKEREALAILQRITPGASPAIIGAIRSTFAGERKPRLADLLGADRRVLPIVWIGVALSCLQQLVGINVIFYYGTTLWEAVGFSAADSLLINVISSTINIAATVIAITLIDRVGRRPLLLWGAVGMTVTLAVLALMFASAATGADGKVTLGSRSGVIALVAANLYVLAFGVSWGPTVWTMLSEMFPNRMRGSGLAVAATAQWLANWLVTVTFPPMLLHLGSGLAYGVYATFAAVAIVFVRRFVVETRGRTLEEMR